MSPAPEKRYKEHTPDWSEPIDPVSLYAGLPRTASNMQRQMTPLQRQMMFHIKGAENGRRDPRKSGECGCDVFAGPGQHAMARELNVDPKTIYRNLKILVEKMYMRVIEKIGPNNRRLGTWYAMPQWEDVFAAQRADPTIAKATVRGKARIVVIGRARRFMRIVEQGDGFVVAANPKNGQRWKLRLAQVPETAEIGGEDEALPQGQQQAIAAAEPDEQPTREIVLDALVGACTTTPGPDDALDALRRAKGDNRGNEIPDEIVAQMVEEIGREHRHKRVRTVGFVLQQLKSKVHMWRNAELQRTAERTRAEARAAREEGEWAPAAEILGEKKRGAG